MSFVYHERQLGGLCGVHCLNNLLQGPHFGPGDLAEIGVELDAQERALLLVAGDGASPAASPGGSSSSACPAGDDAPNGVAEVGGAPPNTEGEAGSISGGLEGQCYNVDPSADGGNFSIQVLSLALGRFGLELLPAKHPRARRLMEDPGNAAQAFVCQCRDHWFAVRQVADCWWNLNSTRKKPALVGPFYLAAWLAQLSAEGYSIYLVLGGNMPESAQPLDPNTPDETFHDFFDLLEESKKSGGNPLAGGEDDTDAEAVAAAVAAADLQDADEMLARGLALGDFDFDTARQLDAGTGGGSGLYSELLRAQQQVRHGTRSARSSPVAASASRTRVDPLVDPARRVEELGGVWWPLSLCLCVPSETVGEAVVSPPVSPMDSVRDLGRATPSAARRPDALEQASSQALRDMGFGAVSVEVAQELARAPQATPALQWLLRAGEGRRQPSDGQGLARDIQGAVLACDCDSEDSFGERLLRVSALLDADGESRLAARAHLQSRALADCMRSLLRHRGNDWPTAYHVAAEAVLQSLLAAFPADADAC